MGTALTLSPAVTGDGSQVFGFGLPEYELCGRAAVFAGIISD